MKTILLSLLMAVSTFNLFSTSWTISNSGFELSPVTLTITAGDDVTFNLEAIHNALEVSRSSWNANGNTALAGGFQVGLGGGQVLPAQFGPGTHYYVCVPHASSGMKGTIIVQSPTGIERTGIATDFSVYPNPAEDIITLKMVNNGQGSEYSITDPGGRIIDSGKLEHEQTSIDISCISRGIYLIGLVDRNR
jgi:plastocyanin